MGGFHSRLAMILNLRCGHTIVSTLHQIIRCPVCRSEFSVSEVVIDPLEWFAQCHDCRFKRWYGKSQELARESARKHCVRNPDHRTDYGQVKRPEVVRVKKILWAERSP